MGTTRFLNKEEDYKKLGLIPGEVQMREDGRIGVDGRPGAEVWYFDAEMEDGTKVVCGVRDKPSDKFNALETHPSIVITVTTPDGKTHADNIIYTAADGEFSREKCDIKVGPHHVSGDLKHYHVSIVPVKHERLGEGTDGLVVTETEGVGVDLHYEALVPPFRPGAGRAVFDDNDEMFSSWFCVPKNAVTGTVTVEGKSYAVSGTGYHDHRRMAVNDFLAWAQWLWGRQYFDDYTVIVYDYVSGKNFGYVSVPLMGVYDKNGKLIVHNAGINDPETTVCEFSDTYHSDVLDQDFPRVSHYLFNIDGKTVEYTLTVEDELELRNFYHAASEQGRAMFDALGMKPSYIRYHANGELKVTENGKTVVRSGKMIYEFASCGRLLGHGKN